MHIFHFCILHVQLGSVFVSAVHGSFFFFVYKSWYWHIGKKICTLSFQNKLLYLPGKCLEGGWTLLNWGITSFSCSKLVINCNFRRHMPSGIVIWKVWDKQQLLAVSPDRFVSVPLQILIWKSLHYIKKISSPTKHVHNLTSRTRALLLLLLFFHPSSRVHLCFPLPTPLPREESAWGLRGVKKGGRGSERVREGAVLDNTIPQIYSIPSVPQVSLY